MTTEEMVKRLRADAETGDSPREASKFLREVADRLEEQEQQLNAVEEDKTQSG